MALTSQEIKELLRMLSLTKSRELTCDECLMRMAEFAECNLQAKSITESLSMMKDHLELCRECQEEYEALLAALKGLGAETLG